MPSQLSPVSFAGRPKKNATATAASGTAASSSPAVELGRRISAVLRKYHGMTISNYVRQRRIERARREVANGVRPLSMIALDAGFADQSHFTRVFRQAFGETPGRYARSLRGRRSDGAT